MAYKSEGVDSCGKDPGSSKRESKESGAPHICGQPSGFELLKEGRWSSTVLGCGSQKDLEMVLGKKLLNSTCSLDTKRGELRGRHVVKGDRFEESTGLGTDKGGYGVNFQPIRPFRSGPVCDERECSYKDFLHERSSLRVPFERCLPWRLDNSKELRLSPIKHDHSCDLSCNQDKSKGSSSVAQMGRGNMVSDPTKDNVFRFSSERFKRRGDERSSHGRNLEELRLDVQSGSSGRELVLALDNGVAILSRMRLANSTMIRYGQEWSRFEAFCTFIDVLPLPASKRSVCLYLVYMFSLKRGASVWSARSAISKMHLYNHMVDPFGENWLADELCKSIKKNWALFDRIPLRRDPFPIQHLVHWVDNRPGSIDEYTYVCYAAVVVLGIRLLARSDELLNLRFGSICFKDGGSMVVSFDASKNDQCAQNRPIPVDPVIGASCCPVTLVKRWFSLNPDHRADDYLFDHNWSSFHISRIVRIMCDHAGDSELVCYSHSLRPGGATEMTKQGFTDTFIRTAGRWNSENVHSKYVRQVSLQTLGLSTRLFKGW